jgi:hypothetical protein
MRRMRSNDARMNADGPDMARREPCEPMLRSWGGRETFCYWPDEREAAEARLPFVPVNPTEAVRRCANLDLTQVLLTTDTGPEVGKPIRRVRYIFGSIPGASGSIPDPAPPEPKFAIVEERPGAFEQQPRLDRTESRMGRAGSQEARTIYGNWQYHANLSGDVHVMVMGNVSGEIIEAIGRAIVRTSDLQ